VDGVYTIIYIFSCISLTGTSTAYCRQLKGAGFKSRDFEGRKFVQSIYFFRQLERDRIYCPENLGNLRDLSEEIQT
jgi:hypothetical protein